MEMQLQELIEQIKKNGVETAEAQAAAILESANAEAQKIISDAKKQADTIILEAKEEKSRLVSVGEEALKQASRNLLITFRESVAKELDAVVGNSVSSVYSSQLLCELILKTVDAWSKDPEVNNITVLLGAESAKALEDTFLAALKAKMLTGVTLRPSNSFDGGFRIAVNDGSAYYDYSTEAVTEMMSAYLTPRVIALLKEAEKA